MFNELGLDPILIQSIKRKGFEKPTEIQKEAIPAFLKGHDVLALSKTGSGKTMAFVLPLLHKMLALEIHSLKKWTALILVPTKELCLQVSMEFNSILRNFPTTLKVCCVTSVGSSIEDSGHVLISTPKIVAKYLQKASSSFQIENVSMLVVDEGDLILSYGYNADMKYICPKVPKSCQCMITSASQSSDLDSIVKLTMERPVRINLLKKIQQLNTGLVSHYFIMCPIEDRMVHFIKEGYRIHLFLECFQIKSFHLHGELPVGTRNKLIYDFNRKLFDVIIIVDDMETKLHEEASGNEITCKEVEFGTTRGLDFKHVRTVINFDLPTSLNGYIHRVGRTGRAENSGMALSLFPKEDSLLFAELEDHLKDGESSETIFKAFQSYSVEHVKALKYRASDVLRSITKKRIAEVRLKDLKKEILKSPEVEEYFTKHPLERKMLDIIGQKTQKRKLISIGQLPGYITGSLDTELPKVENNCQGVHRVPRNDPLNDLALPKRKQKKKVRI